MKRVCAVVFFLFSLLDSNQARVGGLESSFNGSDFHGLTRRLTLCEYDGTLDSSGNLVDVSGSNLVEYSEDLSGWNLVRSSIIVNSYKSPINTLTADAIHEDSTGANDHYVYSNTWTVAVGEVWKGSFYAYALNRSWVMAAYSTARFGVNAVSFDLLNGVVGTQTGATGTIKSVGGGWYLCTIRGIATVAGSSNLTIQIAERNNDPTFDGLDQDSVVVWGAHVRKAGVGTPLPGENNYIYTDTNDKPRLTMAPSATAPSTAYSSFQLISGAKKDARSFVSASSRYYQIAHDNVMNVFDTDYTVTVVYRPTLLDASYYLWSHGNFNTDGAYAYHTSTGIHYWRNFKSGAAQDIVTPASTITLDRWFVVQQVRASNYGSIYVNGALKAGPTDLTGYGVDASRTLTVGANSALSTYGNSHIAYLRIDREGLSVDRLKYEQDKIYGMGVGAGFKDPGWVYDRESTAYKQTSDGILGRASFDMPRVAGKGGGILIEDQTINVCQYSEAFNSWTGQENVVTTPNVGTCPNNELTGDLIHEDATVGAVHRVRNLIGSTTAVAHTYSVYIKKINEDRVSLMLYDGSGHRAKFHLTGEYVYSIDAGVTAGIEPASNGYKRLWMSYTPAAGTIQVYVEALNDAWAFSFNGRDQDSFYACHAQLQKNIKYPTSYIPNLSTSTTTRLADSLTFDPHEANTTNYVLPLTFTYAVDARSKFTVRFDMKGSFSSSSNVSSNRYPIEISGNTGTASTSRNRWFVYVGTDGKVYNYLKTNDSADVVCSTAANPVDFSTWHNYVFTVDLVDGANNKIYIDGIDAVGSAASGTDKVFDTTNTTIRIGQTYDGTIGANFRIKNLEIIPGEYVTP